MTSGLVGKRVLVTGASGDIGSEIIRRFAADGALVGIHFHKNRRRAVELLNSLREHRGEGEIFRSDLMRGNSCRSLVKSFVNRFKGIDVLVNNAGAVIGPGHFLKLSETSWDRTFQLNAKAPFFLAQAAFSYMQAQKTGGRIISISSVAARYGGSAMTLHYGAAKAGLEAMTIGLARAGASENILVNAVQAGFIQTNFHRAITGKNIGKRIAMIPVRRAGQPSDVASAVVYLASDSGDFITGQIIRVTGGD